MKTRILLMIATLCGTAGALALSPQYNEWAKGPAQYLLTKEEAAQWKNIKTDDEAKAFVDLFWARRDPTASTPFNEYKAQFDAVVDFADKNFGMGKRTRGSMTDRGKALILYGQPKRIERSAEPQQPSAFRPSEETGVPAAEPQWIQWVYEGESSTALFATQRAVIRFIDRLGTGDFRFDRGSVDLATAQQRAITKSITQPTLTAVPTYTTVPMPAEAAPVAATTPMPAAAPQQPAQILVELTTDALKKAVADFKAGQKNPAYKTIYATWGEYVTADGETFVPVMLYVPKSTGLDASREVTFFGVVQDETGKNVAAFEEPVKLNPTKDEFYVDKTFFLGAGKTRGIFGIAENDTPVAMVSTEMVLKGDLDKDATAVSPLILSNDLHPLAAAQEVTDPFAFGGVKVIPKADKTFRKSDELWYFFELRNPGLSEDTPPVPKIQVKVDVEGTDATGKKHRIGAPPSAVDAVAMKGVAGHYAVGNAIALQQFVPGDYTFTVKVLDTVKKTSTTISDKFKVVE